MYQVCFMEAYQKYSKYYTENQFWNKLKKIGSKASSKLLFYALLLYYCLIDSNVDIKSKSMIIAALGYLIFPFDAIPDFIPALGLTDDLTALLFVYGKVKGVLTPEIEQKALSRANELFHRV